jgi:predicted dehydrogenase
MLGAGASADSIHLPGYAANPRAEVAGIFSLDRPASERLAAKYAIGQVFDTLNALLSDPTIQAVSISTPPATHEELATAAVREGKHVLIEKPVSTSLASLDRIRKMAEASNLTVELVHNERFMDFNIKAKEVIRSGSLGEIQAVLQFIGTTGPEEWSPGAGWFRNPAVSGGGSLMDLAVHKVDLAGWLIDREIPAVSSAQFEGAAEDLASIHCVGRGGVLVTVTSSWRGPADEATLLVVGTDGMLEGCWSIGELSLRRRGKATRLQTEIPWTPSDRSQVRMIGAFVDACLAGERPVSTDPLWDTGTRRVLEAYARSVPLGSSSAAP